MHIQRWKARKGPRGDSMYYQTLTCSVHRGKQGDSTCTAHTTLPGHTLSRPGDGSRAVAVSPVNICKNTKSTSIRCHASYVGLPSSVANFSITSVFKRPLKSECGGPCADVVMN